MKVARSLIRSRLSRTTTPSLSRPLQSPQCAAFGLHSYADAYKPTAGALKFTFESSQFKVHNLKESPKLETHATKEELIKMYNDMFTIRRMELLCDQYYKNKQIWGFCHLYDGQEAVCVGMEHALIPGDHVITAYRDHGWQYTRGDTIKNIFAEMFGKMSGCARGKGGSMHLYFPENNFYGGNGIVGAQVPVGTGIGLASKQKGDGSCVVTAFGDGAANQGQVECIENEHGIIYGFEFFLSLSLSVLWAYIHILAHFKCLLSLRNTGSCYVYPCTFYIFICFSFGVAVLVRFMRALIWLNYGNCP